jgi:ketosteroid isomerase-like protein
VSLVPHGQLKASGQAVTMPETHVWKIRDGKAIEVREYDTTEAALEAIPDNER